MAVNFAGKAFTEYVKHSPILKTCWRCSVVHISFDLLALLLSRA